MSDNIASHRRNAILPMCFFRDNIQFYPVIKNTFGIRGICGGFYESKFLRDPGMIRADRTSYRLYSA